MSIKDLWNTFIADAKERFLKFETLHGLFLVPVAIAGLWLTFTHLQYILHALAIIVFGSALLYGLYAIFYNPIKKKVAIDILKAKNMIRRELNLPEIPLPNDNTPEASETIATVATIGGDQWLNTKASVSPTLAPQAQQASANTTAIPTPIVPVQPVPTVQPVTFGNLTISTENPTGGSTQPANTPAASS